MKVRELIAQLEELPSDADVVYETGDHRGNTWLEPAAWAEKIDENTVRIY